MRRKDKDLKKQDAPLKNTDKAFVKVNKDGSPGIHPPNERYRHEYREQKDWKP